MHAGAVGALKGPKELPKNCQVGECSRVFILQKGGINRFILSISPPSKRVVQFHPYRQVKKLAGSVQWAPQQPQNNQVTDY